MAQKSARRDNLTNGISPTKTHIISSIHNLLRCYLQWMKGPSCRHRAEPLSTHSAGESDGRDTCLLFRACSVRKSLGSCCQKKTASRKKKTRAKWYPTDPTGPQEPPTGGIHGGLGFTGVFTVRGTQPTLGFMKPRVDCVPR